MPRANTGTQQQQSAFKSPQNSAVRAHTRRNNTKNAAAAAALRTYAFIPRGSACTLLLPSFLSRIRMIFLELHTYVGVRLVRFLCAPAHMSSLSPIQESSFLFVARSPGMRGTKVPGGGVSAVDELRGQIPQHLPDREVPAPATRHRLPAARVEAQGAEAALG